MGGGRNKQKRGRTQRRHFGDGRENVWKKPRAIEGEAADAAAGPPAQNGGAGWDPFVTNNPNFEVYYKKQGVISESEWDDFIATLHKPLPAVFRINASGQFAEDIANQIQHEFIENLTSDNVIGGQVDQFIRPLSWYPGKLAWHLNFSRMQLRKNQTLSRIHEFLKRENVTGSITRQEAVSMVPPLFLDVHPHHHVLDMCAAPGSKTFQLLEMIHSADKPGLLPDGLVVANDLDVQRCHLLIHQTKRMCSPNVVVTNHEAQHFPGLKKDQEGAQANGAESLVCNVESGNEMFSLDAPDEEKGLAFDRVLCDVPCSGDGTMRKAPDLWKKWNVGMGNGLHRLQVQIAMRGVALLRVGGRLVYSTCSLNPVENEAVVGEILRRSNGCMELLDVSAELPELKRRPGLKTWKVKDKGQWFSSCWQVKKHRAGSIVPGMFPAVKDQEEQSELVDVDETAAQEEDRTSTPNVEVSMADEEGMISELPLERCMRILPHDQDTGGFFIAVFGKVANFKVNHSMEESTRSQKVASDGCIAAKEKLPEPLQETCLAEKEHVAGLVQGIDTTSLQCMEKHDENCAVDVNEKDQDCDQKPKQAASRVQRQGTWKGVDPVLFLNDKGIIESLIDFYGIKETFPLNGHLITRSEDTSRLKRIYYASGSVANVMKMNLRAGNQMKLTSIGLKLFERQGGKEGFSPCAFRIASEGLPLLLPHMSRQIVHAPKQDFKHLLLQRTAAFTAFIDEAFRTAVQALHPGCCVVILEDQGTSDTTSVIAIGCWRGRTNMSLLIPQEDVAQLLERRFPGEACDALEEELVDPIKEDTDAMAENDSAVFSYDTIHHVVVDEQVSLGNEAA